MPLEGDSPLQLQDHTNAVVALQARRAVRAWDAIADEERPSNVSMEWRLDTVLEALRTAFTELPSHSPITSRLTTIMYHLTCVQRVVDLSIVSSFKRLGAGSFATVLVQEGRDSIVVKQVKNPSDAPLLSKEHADLEQLWRMCSMNGPQLFQLPRAHGYYSDYCSFAKEIGIPQTEDLGLLPHALYVMQRIWPVPFSLTTKIRDEFFPEEYHGQSTHPFLARLYFGRPVKYFNSENFPLDAERIEKLQLPAAAIADGMGRTLALINFFAGKDGRGIEFVLCGNPDNPLSKDPSFACIDFNQIRPHNGDVGAICSSITSNDPYYPRPESPYWDAFKQAYITTAAAAPTPANELAEAVMAQLQTTWASQGNMTGPP
mmetsp:Transcript_28792/g.63441  ORF Transcript_28792/g.63441 Transcript_28792/m.63441 type:complete len:374 (+) Transcript_28792:195-1316(+)|eukprot:CAMPEP_0202910506 /NCGR_PEP_ID=MMETSP1392-20130828/52219_1 /ASSEMBLY_ACC=CAM_ASM_000868 /TAXON_ID=225041 /ORGANISM="Chlamydomonas chlamydogama, Strain SAG 11-48b" /LENGTH=373 /DNA_ID=CAMNT_0049600639 /DNA_START=181 /DNA_END=1302 /DNA_ORIENTATION=+